MKRSFVPLVLSLLGALHSRAADAPHAELDSKHRAFFKDNCLTCHNAEKQKGKVRLDNIPFTVDSVERADLWQKVLNSINSGDMPPEDEKQPAPDAKTDFLDDLSRTLVTARGRLSDSGGNIAMRRLNRREYKNTLRDLLGVDINVRELPADGGAGTFDTVGSSLYMSSDQFEQYLALGRQALDEHFARAAVISTKPAIQHVEAEEWANKMAKQFADMYQEGFDRWKAWQASGGKPPEDFKFSDKGAAEFAKVQFERHWPYFDLYQKLPLVKQGAYLTIYDITTHVEIDGDKNLPVGDYILRLRVGAVPGTPKSNHVIEVGHRGERKGEFSILSHHEITGSTEQPQILEIPVRLTTSSNRRFSIRAKQPLDPHAVFDMWNDARLKNGTGPTPSIWIDWVELEGPAVSPVVAANAKPRSMHVEVEAKNSKIAKSLAERTDAHDRYVKWTAAVEAAAQKPENAAITTKIRAEKKGDDRHFYAQWQRILGAPAPKDFGFVDEIHADEQGRRNWVHYVPYQKAYVNHPATKSGTFLTIEDVFVNPYQPFRIPGDWPAGDYVVRVRIAATSNTPASRHFVEFGSQHDTGVRAVASSHHITGTMENPQVLKIPLKFSPSKGYGFFFQEKGTYESEDVAHRLFSEGQKANGIGPEFALWIDWIEVVSAADARLAAKPQSFKTRTEAEVLGNRQMEGLFKKTLEQHQNHARWAAAVDAAAARPENVKIAAELREKAKQPRPASGVPFPSPLFFYLDWEQINGAPSPVQFGFKDAQQGFVEENLYNHFFPYYEDYQKLPARDKGAWLMFYLAYRETHVEADKKWPAGRYTLRMRVAANDFAPRERCFIEIGQRGEDVSQFTVLGAHQVTGTLAQPQIIETTVDVKPDGKREFAVRERRPNTRQAEIRSYHDTFEKTGHGPVPAIWIDWLELEGPVADAPAAPALTKTIKDRREVELHANAMVGGTYNGYFKGGYEAAKKFLETGKSQKGIPDAIEAKFRVQVFEQHGPSFERYLNDPLTKTGAFLTIYNVHTEEVITLPPDKPSGWLKAKHEVEKAEPGDYMLRFRIGAVKGTAKDRHFVALGSRKAGAEDFTLLQTFQISGSTEAPQIIEVPVSISADGPRTFVLREKRDVKLDFDTYTASRKETKVGPPSALWIDWVEWEGPLVKQTPIAKVQHIEPEKRRADVERAYKRYQFLNEQYAKWKSAGGDEAKLKDFGFNDKSHAEFGKYVWDHDNRWLQQYLDWPLSKSGLYLDNTVTETSEYAIDLPADAATGDYVMRVKIGRVPGMPAERAFLNFVEASPIDKDDRTFLTSKQITGTLDKPEVIELAFKVRPGGPRKFALFEKRPLKKEAISLAGRTRLISDAKLRDPVLWIDWIEYEGPLNKVEAASQVKPVIATGDTNARTVLENFAERAFRGKKPSTAFLDKLTALYEVRRNAGDVHETALKEPLSVILASPGFLYLQETGGQQEKGGSPISLSHRPIVSLSPAEFASRLSYFLWSAPPDEQLLASDLTKPDILAREVDRMIASDKADEFVSGFVHQWLGMDRLEFFQFDTKQFRDFDESAKAAARREVYETFAYLLRQRGSLSRLLKSDEIHINGLLATYYGIDGVSGDAFQKVTLPKDSPRGGLLGMAAILAMGSNGERTSPVERGAWVLRKLMHNPPPPAPPNVPQLDRLASKPISPRARLLAHQEQPQCLQCHRKIDPIGFGLENFNAAGKWRDIDHDPKTKKDWPIDPAGQLYNGPAFKGYFDLRDLIAARSENFAQGFTEALIEYALGRPYGFTDVELAANIVKQAKSKDFTIREFIVALVQSPLFQQK